MAGECFQTLVVRDVTLGEGHLLLLGQDSARQLEETSLLLFQVVGHRDPEVGRRVLELGVLRIETADRLDELVKFMVLREGMAADIQTGVVHQHRRIEKPLLGRGVSRQLDGEIEKCLTALGRARAA